MATRKAQMDFGDIDLPTGGYSNEQLLAYAMLENARPILQVIWEISERVKGGDIMGGTAYKYLNHEGDTKIHHSRIKSLNSDIPVLLAHLDHMAEEIELADMFERQAAINVDRLLVSHGLLEVPAPTETAPTEAAPTQAQKATAKAERDTAKALAKIDKKNNKK